MFLQSPALLGVAALLAPAALAKSSATAPSWSDAHNSARDFVAALTLEEKVSLTTGIGWANGHCVGNIAPIPRVNFPGLCLQDSPLGVRFADRVSAFPAGINVAATFVFFSSLPRCVLTKPSRSFDRNLFKERGAAMGAEHYGKGVNIALGPMMCVSFALYFLCTTIYYPFIIGTWAASQKVEGTGKACVSHSQLFLTIFDLTPLLFDLLVVPTLTSPAKPHTKPSLACNLRVSRLGTPFSHSLNSTSDEIFSLHLSARSTSLTSALNDPARIYPCLDPESSSFYLNSEQEHNRTTSSSDVDDRTVSSPSARIFPILDYISHVFIFSNMKSTPTPSSAALLPVYLALCALTVRPIPSHLAIHVTNPNRLLAFYRLGCAYIHVFFFSSLPFLRYDLPQK